MNKFLGTRYQFRKNVVKGKIEFKLKRKDDFRELKTADFNDIVLFLNEKHGRVYPNELQTLLYSSFSKEYDPFTDYINKLPKWDGHDHVGELADTIQCSDHEFFKTALRRWYLAMVATILDDKINHQVLILIGDQGIGKTTWVNRMIPPEWSEYIHTGRMNGRNKDDRFRLTDCILINIDEIDSLSKAEFTTLKEVITKPKIQDRRPYARFNEDFKRRASFLATTNSKNFLESHVENRRYLPFQISDINLDFDINYPQLFAQLLALYKGDEKYWFDGDEINYINDRNRQFQQVDMLAEVILSRLAPCQIGDEDEFMNATDVISYLRKGLKETGILSYAANVGRKMTALGFCTKKTCGISRYAVKIVGKQQTSKTMTRRRIQQK